MSYTHPSDSFEQQEAESYIFSFVEKKLGIPLIKHQKLYLSDNPSTYILPDFYSGTHHILGEIFSHLGRPKKAQNNKIANDILKMLAYEKVTGIQHRKILVICDPDEYAALKGLSVLAESIRLFNVELLLVEIPENMRQTLRKAQARQKMVNP